MILPVGKPRLVNLAHQLQTNLEFIAPTKIDIQIAEFTYQKCLISAITVCAFMVRRLDGWIITIHIIG